VTGDNIFEEKEWRTKQKERYHRRKLRERDFARIKLEGEE
jgi:hypothetical protein